MARYPSVKFTLSEPGQHQTMRHLSQSDPTLSLDVRTIAPSANAPIVGTSSFAYGSTSVQQMPEQVASSFSPKLPVVHQPSNYGAPHNPFMHYPSGGSSSSHHVGQEYTPSWQMPSSSGYPNRSAESSPDPELDCRTYLKRKSTANLLSVNGLGSSGYAAGSSSSQPFHSAAAPESWTMPQHVAPQRDWNHQLLINQEGFERSVRRRCQYNSQSDHRASSSSAMNTYSSQYNSTANVNPVAPIMPPFPIPQGGQTSQGASILNPGARPFYPSQTTYIMSSPTLPQGAAPARAVHPQRPPTLAPVPSLFSAPSPAIIAAATASSLQPNEVGNATQPRTRSRSAFLAPVSNARSRRQRNNSQVLPPVPLFEDRSISRWAPEAPAQHFVALQQQLAAFGSGGALDPHWNMRLDVDNMSYEELLALEERIGEVNTGLSEDRIRSSMTEIVCCSGYDPSQPDSADQSCPICLEAYQDGECLGRLRCRHDFHATCLGSWLRLKNSCPVCKAPAAPDNAK